MLRSKVTLLFLAFAVMLAVGGTALALTTDTGGTTTAASPSISSDKEDYAPGETVTLTGSNWQPGEAVHINVNDDQGKTWSREVDVTADDSGNVTDTFQLPSTFVAVYKVTRVNEFGKIVRAAVKSQARFAFDDRHERVVKPNSIASIRRVMKLEPIVTIAW